ncbi:MAG: hypothetical protein ABL974_15100, partial [Prosthecobacter sp.]
CLDHPEGGNVAINGVDTEITKERRDQELAEAERILNTPKDGSAVVITPTLPQAPIIAENSLSRGAAPRGLGGVSPTPSGRSMRDHPERRLETAARRGDVQAAAALAGIPMAAGGVMEDHIEGKFDGFEYGRLFKLQNGTIWEQTDTHFEYHYEYAPKAMILTLKEGIFLQVEGLDKKVQVRQVR